MQSIIKRSGKQEAYDRSKIARAMKKSFQSVDEQADQVRIEDLLKQAEAEFSSRDNLSVEEIQDIVEQTLMKNGCYAAAKSYILYREKRTELRKSREQLIHEIGMDSIAPVLAKIQRDFPTYDLNRLAEKYSAMDKADLDEQAKLDQIGRAHV